MGPSRTDANSAGVGDDEIEPAELVQRSIDGGLFTRTSRQVCSVRNHCASGLPMPVGIAVHGQDINVVLSRVGGDRRADYACGPVTIAARHVGSGVSRLSVHNGGLTDSGEVRMTKRSPQNEVGERRCCAGCFLLENVAGCVGVGSAHVGDELGVRGGQCRYPVELGGGGDLFFEVHEAL